MRNRGEPSVEEILDSIKRVIARDTTDGTMDERLGTRRLSAVNYAEPAAEDEATEVLELGEEEMVSRPGTEEDSVMPMDDEDEGTSYSVAYNSHEDEREDSIADTGNIDDALSEGTQRVDPVSDDDAIVRTSIRDHEDDDPLTSAIVRDAMREKLSALSAATGGAQPRETSLEGLTRDLLRPMLAEWLDQNLPAIVERLVKAEISRISSRRG